jgi:flagellar biosynthesis GTPase FlhF
MILLLICFFSLIIGLVNPRLVIRWGNPEKRTRGKVFQIYGLGLIASFIAFGITAPDTNVDNAVSANVSENSNDADAKKQAKAEAKAQKEADAKAKAEADAQAKAEAKAQKESEAKAKAEADAQAKAEAEAKAKAEAEAKAPRPGDTVKAGNFSIAVYDPSTAASVGDKYLSQKAKGIYWIFPVAVRNDDKEARTVDSSMFELVSNTGVKYAPDATAALYMNTETKFFLEKINPGIILKGYVVFDMPKDQMIVDYKMQVRGGIGFATTKPVDILLKAKE